MLGKTHAASGWCAGLAAAPLVGLTRLPEVLVFAVVTAGMALLPDLDHPGARASRLVGPVTGGISWALRRFSEFLYRHTKGPRDENCTGGHRHATHTLAFALLLGGLTALGGATWGRWFVLAVVVFGVLLAEDALGDWILPVAVSAGVLLAVAGGGFAALDGVGGWLGIAVGLGCFVHCLGDSLTLSGCPWLYPIPIRGETFFELRPPAFMRFRTGGSVETGVLFPAFTVLGVLLIPGVWALAVTVVTAVFNHRSA